MNISKLIEIRKHLHKHPETSDNEIETSSFILQTLQSIAPNSEILKLKNRAVLATFKSENKGESILLRCDMDALNIQEINTFEHQSIHKGIAHKCGHDGHSTIMLGVAMHLANHPIEKGSVTLLFQPSEENGKGALGVLNDETFKNNFNPDYVFALHNTPGFPMGAIILKENNFNPAVISLVVTFEGKTAHAAEPEQGTNPCYAIAELLTLTRAHQNTDQNSSNFSLITPVHGKYGSEDYGIAAGNGKIGFTLRTWNNQKLEVLQNWLLETIKSIAQKEHLEYKVDWTQSFKSSNNHPEAVEFIRKSAITNQLNIIEKTEPFRWGEDFGLFTEKYKGAMFALGAGENTPALHNPDYDFPDEIITPGIQTFVGIIDEIVSSKN